jgi:hypothetical protein
MTMIGAWTSNRCEEHGTKLDAAGYCDLCTEAAAEELYEAIMAARARRASVEPIIDEDNWQDDIHPSAEYLDVVHL